jgi:hypothetical protein
VSKHAPPSAEELGDQVAYTALRDGTPVYNRDGRRIRVVEHVMAVGGIFEGVIVHTHPLPGHHLYAHADQIAEIRERGILLSVAADELDDVSASRRWADGDRGLEPRLRRAWDWLNSKL